MDKDCGHGVKGYALIVDGYKRCDKCRERKDFCLLVDNSDGYQLPIRLCKACIAHAFKTGKV
jgi:hypothetical protein